MNNVYPILTAVKIGIKSSHVKIVIKLTRVKYWYQILTDVKNWYLIVTDVSDKTVKKWNRIQNAADWGGGYFINVRKTHVCNMKDFVRIFPQSMRYWHEISDVLVPTFHVL